MTTRHQRCGDSKKKLVFIIYSKDRGVQLELLLRSCTEMYQGDLTNLEFFIIYKASTSDFESGYQRVKEMHPSCHLVPQIEQSFLTVTVEILKSQSAWLVCLSVDDIVFRRPWSLESKEFHLLESCPEIAALSLRLSPHIRFCSVFGVTLSPRRMTHDGTFAWKPGIIHRCIRFFQVRLGIRTVYGDLAWDMPMCLDGNVYRYEDILNVLCSIKEPATMAQFEAFLLQNSIPGRLGIAFPDAIVVNLPMTKVDDSNFVSMGLSLEGFNQLFLASNRIALQPIVDTATNSTHLNLAPVWEPI